MSGLTPDVEDKHGQLDVQKQNHALEFGVAVVLSLISGTLLIGLC